MGVRVAVVGGGITGLAAAWELARSGADLEVDVLEGSPVTGGKLRLAEVGGLPVDVGAESVLARRPEVLDLVGELGAAARLTHPSGVPASIVSAGRRWPMPRGTVLGVPSDPESVRGLLTDAEVARLVAERVGPPVAGDVAVGTFVEERLGAAVTDKLVEPLLAGVYAGHSREISLEMAVPALLAAAREGRSLLDLARRTAAVSAPPSDGVPAPVFATLAGGLGGLPALLGAALADAGVRVLTDTTVRRLTGSDGGWTLTTGPTVAEVERRYDAVVLAAPAAPTARLLAETAPVAAQLLSGVEYASMAVVTFAVDGRPEVLEGSSGFLVPPTEALTIKASTFSSAKWPWLRDAAAERTWLRASVGRHREEASLQRSDAELVEVALRDLHAVVGPGLPDPVDAHVQRWGGGLPQYAVGHRERVEAVRADLPPTLAVAGAVLDGVGVPACVASGRAAASTVLTRLREASPGLR